MSAPAVGTAAGQQGGPPSGSTSRTALASYALDAPDLSIVLPPRLAEVSGVAALSGTELACVQDEDGVVFVYDLAQRRIVRQIPFGPPGDYEGVAVEGSRLFVLRSDGVLFEIRGLSGAPSVRTHRLQVPPADYEGLCPDARNRRLLIAPKGRLSTDKGFRNTRWIFAYDLDEEALKPGPVVILDVEEVRTLAGRQSRQAPATRKAPGGRGGPAVRLMPSAIAVHPATSEVFVVSAVDRVLATFDKSGRVTGVTLLDPALLRQPEGLTFLANGDLVITSEASGARPMLHLFKPRSQPAR